MSSYARPAIGDRLLAAGGLLILRFALGAIDERLRERASMLVSGAPPVAGVSDVGGRVGGLVRTAAHVTRVWTGEHVYLTIFAVAGVVLLVGVRRL